MDYNARLDLESQRDRIVHDRDPERIKRDITAAGLSRDREMEAQPRSR